VLQGAADGGGGPVVDYVLIAVGGGAKFDGQPVQGPDASRELLLSSTHFAALLKDRFLDAGMAVRVALPGQMDSERVEALANSVALVVVLCDGDDTHFLDRMLQEAAEARKRVLMCPYEVSTTNADGGMQCVRSDFGVVRVRLLVWVRSVGSLATTVVAKTAMFNHVHVYPHAYQHAYQHDAHLHLASASQAMSISERNVSYEERDQRVCVKRVLVSGLVKLLSCVHVCVRKQRGVGCGAWCSEVLFGTFQTVLRVWHRGLLVSC
jgi:hypothetical protein